jgi:hypothetical protein
MDRIADANGVIDFLDSSDGETRFYDAEGNYTWSVGVASTAITFASAVPNPADINQAVTLTASVIMLAPIPGVVAFFDGLTAVGAAPVSLGTAFLDGVRFLSGGDHSLSAAYSGDSTYAACASAAFTETVRGAGADQARTLSLFVDNDLLFTPSVHLPAAPPTAFYIAFSL